MHFFKISIVQIQPNYSGGAPPGFNPAQQQSDHYLVTQVKNNDPAAPPPAPYSAPTYKPETPFNGQPFVIEPSYLLKPFRHYQSQPYQTPTNGPPHQVFHPVTYHHTPIYHVSLYQQHPSPNQAQAHNQPSALLPTVFSSVALLYSTPVLAYSTPLSSYDPTIHSNVPYVASSPVRQVAETAAPPPLYADDSSEVNDLGKRYVTSYGNGVAQATKDDGSKVSGNKSKLVELVYNPTKVANLHSAGGKVPIESNDKENESAYQYATQRNPSYTAQSETKENYQKESSEAAIINNPVTEISLQQQAKGDNRETTGTAKDEEKKYEAVKETSDEVVETEAVATEATSYDSTNGVDEITTETKNPVEPEVSKNAADESAEEKDPVQVEVDYQPESAAVDAGTYASDAKVETSNPVAEPTAFQQEEPAYYQAVQEPVIVEQLLADTESSEVAEPIAVAAHKEEQNTYKPVHRLEPVIIEAEMTTESGEVEDETEVPPYPKSLGKVIEALYASVDTAKTVDEEVKQGDAPSSYSTDYAAKEVETYAPVDKVIDVVINLPEPLPISQDYNTPSSAKESSTEVVGEEPVEVPSPKIEEKYVAEDVVQDTQQQAYAPDNGYSTETVDKEEIDATDFVTPIFYPDEPEIVTKIEPVFQEDPVNSYSEVPVVTEKATEIASLQAEIKEEPAVVEPTYEEEPVQNTETRAYIAESLTSEADEMASVPAKEEQTPETVAALDLIDDAPVVKIERYVTKETYSESADAPAEPTSSTPAYVPEKEVNSIIIEAVPVHPAVASIEKTSSIPAVSYETEIQEITAEVSYQTEVPSYAEPEVVTDKIQSAEETSAEAVKTEKTQTADYPVIQGAVSIDLTPVVAYEQEPVVTPVTEAVTVANPVVKEDSSAESRPPPPKIEVPETIQPVAHVAPCAFSGLRGPGSLHYHTAALANLPLDSYEYLKEDEPAQTTLADDLATPTSTATPSKPSYTSTASEYSSAEKTTSPAPTVATTATKDTSAEEVKTVIISALLETSSVAATNYSSDAEEVDSPAYISPESPSSTAASKDTSAEVTTTASPVTKRKFTPRSRFSTTRPPVVQETVKPSTAAPALVVIGKPAEVRKPINGKLYSRTSSLPEAKRPSLPQVKILPSRLRIPSPSTAVKRNNDEQLERRYFVGRPPVAYETRGDEEETEEY